MVFHLRSNIDLFLKKKKVWERNKVCELECGGIVGA